MKNRAGLISVIVLGIFTLTGCGQEQPVVENEVVQESVANVKETQEQTEEADTIYVYNVIEVEFQDDIEEEKIEEIISSVSGTVVHTDAEKNLYQVEIEGGNKSEVEEICSRIMKHKEVRKVSGVQKAEGDLAESEESTEEPESQIIKSQKDMTEEELQELEKALLDLYKDESQGLYNEMSEGQDLAVEILGFRHMGDENYYITALYSAGEIYYNERFYLQLERKDINGEYEWSCIEVGSEPFYGLIDPSEYENEEAVQMYLEFMENCLVPIAEYNESGTIWTLQAWEKANIAEEILEEWHWITSFALGDLNYDGVPELILADGEVERVKYICYINDENVEVIFAGNSGNQSIDGSYAASLYEDKETGEMLTLAIIESGSGAGNLNEVDKILEDLTYQNIFSYGNLYDETIGDYARMNFMYEGNDVTEAEFDVAYESLFEQYDLIGNIPYYVLGVSPAKELERVTTSEVSSIEVNAGEKVTLYGTVATGMYEHPHHGEEEAAILIIESPLTLHTAEGSVEITEAHITGTMSLDYFMGKSVYVTGTAVEQHTGYHARPLVLIDTWVTSRW